MNKELREKRIEFRISQALESLMEADTLFQASLFRGAVNRAYYSMFYATLALTVLKERVISRHSGLIADKAEAENAIKEAREYVDRIAKYISTAGKI